MTPREAVPSDAADWVENAFKLQLTEFQRKAVRLMCRAAGCGPYDFSTTFKNADWQFGHGVSFVVPRHCSTATYDSAGLTRLVIGAHEESIRVEIAPCNFTRLRISMHPRLPGLEGLRISQRHPTIEQAVESYRAAYSDEGRMY